jgi:hypothetical protein
VRAQEAKRWEVAMAIRIAPQKTDRIAVRVALPLETPTTRIRALDVAARGLDAKIVREDEHPHVLLRGRLKGSRRVAVRFTLESLPGSDTMPQILPLETPQPDLLAFLMPAPLFQSRSILVRDFLEAHVAPVYLRDNDNLLRAIFEVTRDKLEHRGDGKSLPLDVIRRGQGKRIGIERAFTTFLRCARFPARFVEGIRLDSSTRRKRVFWTEVWSPGRWWPVSASQGRFGRLPPSYVGMARDGTRVVRVVEGSATASYAIHSQEL